VRTLNQKERSPMAVEDQVVVIFAATNGFLDRVSVDRVPEFHEDLISRMHAEYGDLREKIAAGTWDDEIESELREAVADFADDFGYDLDEDGMSADEPDAEPTAGSADEESEDEDGADETADEPEKEAAPA
jgi:F-type H+-transporting ATPase subunit alpha